MSTETTKKQRKPRRNFEKLVNETALYCRTMSAVLANAATLLGPNSQTAENMNRQAEAYADILARLEPKQ